MKILLSVENFYPRLGGGEVFIDELMQEFSKYHDCRVVYSGERKADCPFSLTVYPFSKVYKHVPFFNKTHVRLVLANKIWKNVLEKEVRSFKPDLMLTSLEYIPASVAIAKKYGLKVVVFIQNYDHFCPSIFHYTDPFESRDKCFSSLIWQHKFQYPFIKYLLNTHHKALNKSDLIICNSNYVSQVLYHYYKISSHVFYPVLSLDDFIIDKRNYPNDRKFITFINPIRTKGASIVYGIVKKMKHANFLVVGGVDQNWIHKFKAMPNVTYLPWADDMKKIYSQSKLLLVPSTWPEPFGRVVVEAGINAVPSITSHIGGVPEAVGKGGIVVRDLKNIGSWIDAINTVLTDYRKYSKEAKKHASTLIHKKQVALLRDIFSTADIML
jgi:glycosyltransferase involved in cell wall biosynthesis